MEKHSIGTRLPRISGFFALLALSCGCFCAGAADAFPVSAWLAAQTNLQTWSADLIQTRRLRTLTQPLTSTGHVWFVAPNQFRWEIGSPAQTIAVRAGDEMLVIYPRLKRVEKYPLTADKMGPWKDTLSLLEAGFPRSQADVDRQFNVLSTTITNDTSAIVLQPKSASARRMMSQITVVVSTNTAALKGTELAFGDGSTMRNDFYNSKANQPVDPALFRPVIPPNFKVTEPLKAGK